MDYLSHNTQSEPKIKILWLTYDFPYFPAIGPCARQFFLIRELSQKCDIYLLSGIKADELDHIKSIQPYCKKVEYAISRTGRTKGLAYSLLIRKNTRFKNLSFYHKLCYLIQLIEITFDPTPRFCYRHEIIWRELRPHAVSLLKEISFDFIVAEHSDIAHWVTGLNFHGKKILAAHNVKSLLWLRHARALRPWLSRFLARVKAIQFYFYERKFMHLFDLLCVTSKKDGELLQKINPRIKKMTVTSNGVDTAYFQSNSPGYNPNKLLFIGTFDYEINEDACLWLLREILPEIKAKRPDIDLDIIGRKAPPSIRQFESNSIHIHETVSDIRSFMQKAAVFVVPLRAGSGTRLKILDGMAMRKAIVSTSIGAEGIDYSHGENIIIADTAQEFAQAIIDLMAHPNQIESLGKKARQMVEKTYDWKIIGTKYLHEIKNLQT